MKGSEGEVKTNADREKCRMELYCGVYVAIAKHPTAAQDTAKSWASRSVENFDRKFPQAIKI